jgi:hypothetical protein
LNNLGIGLCIGFAVLGILFFGLIVHESYHIFNSDRTSSVCLDFGQSTSAHIIAVDSTPDSFEEPKAIAIQSLVCALLTVLVVSSMVIFIK